MKKKKRAKLYQELYAFNEKLMHSLRFEQRPVREIVASFEQISKIYSGEESLDGEDRERVMGYLNMLGKSDAISEVEFLSAKREELKGFMDMADEGYRRYGSLYIKIFFMVGILVAVLLA